MASPRRRCPSLAALAVYLAINLCAGGLHHHPERPRSRARPAAANPALELPATSPAEDACDEDTCLLCRLLHVPQTLAVLVRVETGPIRAGKAIPAVALAGPHSLEKTTHSRAPPSVG